MLSVLYKIGQSQGCLGTEWLHPSTGCAAYPGSSCCFFTDCAIPKTSRWDTAQTPFHVLWWTSFTRWLVYQPFLRGFPLKAHGRICPCCQPLPNKRVWKIQSYPSLCTSLPGSRKLHPVHSSKWTGLVMTAVPNLPPERPGCPGAQVPGHVPGAELLSQNSEAPCAEIQTKGALLNVCLSTCPLSVWLIENSKKRDILWARCRSRTLDSPRAPNTF